MTTLSRFTPSNHDPRLLEELFVARHELLATVMRRVEEASKSTQRNHTLLVGPRGAGKTHLVSLAHARTQQLRQDGAQLQVSWLQEDLYWVTSYRELLQAIVQALDPAPDQIPRGSAEIEQLLAQSIDQHGPIVVFIENLDQVLDAIGELGQQQLRRLCQDSGALVFVATTTAITRYLADQAHPFYGFFTANELAPFTDTDAIEMLTKIAHYQGDEHLASYLESGEALPRIRAIAHLAGGQPRIWATLAAGLTAAGLRDLVSVLLTEFDNLTPYYQEQLGRLAPQQKRVVNQLLTSDHPLGVSEIAERLDANQKSIAKTLAELRSRNWVIPTESPLLEFVDKRRSYHELAEPLARLAWQIKNARGGEPIAVVIEFCKLWFDEAETDAATIEPSYLQATRSSDGWDHLTITRALRRLPKHAEPSAKAIGEVHDAVIAPNRRQRLPRAQPSPCTATSDRRPMRPDLAESLIETARELNDIAARQFGNVPHPDMHRWISRTEQILTRSNTDQDRTRLAGWHASMWDFDLASKVTESITEPLSRALARSTIAAC